MSGIIDVVEGVASAAAKPLWVRVLPYVAVVLVVGGVVYAAYDHGYDVAENKYKLIVETNAKNAANAQTKAVSDARKEEQETAAAQAFIDRQLLERATNEITSRDNTIAGLNSGSLRLRQRFTCPSTASSLPSASTSTGSSDAATQGGLQRADAEFLVRFASDANQVTTQLQACQALVQADRGVKIISTK